MSSNNKTTESESNGFAKNWELNLYELNRMPHEIIYDDTEIAVSPKILQNELMCPICLDILKNTMTTKECLHRFCHDCIITALRAGNKECPTCRKKLISKRSLRPDPNFDGIIAKIYPNRKEYDELHEKVLQKLNKKHLTAISSSINNNNNTNNSNNKTNRQSSRSNTNNGQNSTESNELSDKKTSSLEETKTNEPTISSTAATSSNRGTKRNALQPTNSDDSDIESRTSTEQSSLHLQNDLDEIELVLKPHPLKEQSLNSKRFLKTTSNATINHLSKYLWTRLCVEASSSSSVSDKDGEQQQNSNSIGKNENDDFEIFINSAGGDIKSISSFQALNQNQTLEIVIDKHWKLNRPLELFYYLKKNECTANGASSSMNEANGHCNSSSSGGNRDDGSCRSSSTSSTSRMSTTSSCNANGQT